MNGDNAMYLSKSALAFLLLAGAGLFGWFAQGLLGQSDASHSVALVAPAAGSVGGAAPAGDGSPPTGTGPADQGPLAMEQSQTVAPDASNMNVTIVNSATETRTSNATQITPVSAPSTGRGTNAVVVRSGTPAPSGVRVVAIPVPVGPAVAPGTAAAPAPPRVSINGNHIVIASDGSVVFVGDDGKLNANTGPTSASGTVAIDTAGSQVQSGSSGGTASGSYGGASGGTASGASGASGATAGVASGGTTAALSGSSDVTGEGGAKVTLITTSGGTAATHSNGSLDSVLSGTGSDGRSVAIAGFEDHSVSVIGDDHLITYDDSNVFIDRDGQVNANTGDTDSSGLNVVDAVGSVVRSGNSGDGEGNDDEEEEDEAEDPVGLPTDSDPDDSVPDDGETDDESDIAGASSLMASLPATQSTSDGSAMVDDEDVTTSASGFNPFVIGADGFDDVSIRVNGNRDIVTYDDSNVVIGGTGGVNAQIGDSDTAGAVVMGVRNSYIQAGCEGDLCYTK
jgi:hypothetical protein